MFNKDVSHLQRSISGNALYPALCAGLTSYALTALTLHLVPLYFALDALRYHALPALALHLKAL